MFHKFICTNVITITPGAMCWENIRLRMWALCVKIAANWLRFLRYPSVDVDLIVEICFHFSLYHSWRAAITTNLMLSCDLLTDLIEIPFTDAFE